MSTMVRASFSLVLGAVLFTIGGCGQTGGLGDLGGVLTPPGRSQIGLVAEVQWVDARSQQIEARMQDGRWRIVAYDSGTRVVYREQDYPVSSLERGDVVFMRIWEIGSRTYTDLIQVQQSVQDRAGTGAGSLELQRIEGTVEAIDHQRGSFELRSRDLRTLMVTLPYNARTSNVDRFRRLRRGEFVRVEGRFISQQRFELEYFL